jgi:hypothetical protein
MGSTRHMATLYEGEYTDPDGKSVFSIWHMSRSDFADATTNTKVEEMDNGIDLPSTKELYTYEPQDTISSDGTPIDIEVSRGVMSLKTTINAGGGTIKPSIQTSTGYGSSYDLLFPGCTTGDDGTVIMNGLTLITTDETYVSRWRSNWEWHTLLNASLIIPIKYIYINFN